MTVDPEVLAVNIESVREIGSDYASLAGSELSEDREPPWRPLVRDTAYAETGRQALEIVARVLARRGVDELVVPGYLCESMIEPFRRRGWRITPLGTTPDLRLRRGVGWSRLRDHGRRSAVLLASYFGYSPDAEHIEASREAQEFGSTVIEDETHRVFAPGGVDADITFGSLRKLLPVADGAYVQGDADVLAEIEKLESADGARWAAMDLKRESQEGDEPSRHREVFAAANEQLEDPRRLYRASERTIETIRRIPYERFAAIRSRNAVCLRNELDASVGALSNTVAPVPSHYVATIENPAAVQRLLAQQQIYCPIHWPPVSGYSPPSGWRSDLISLPIDHRYTSTDMKRIAEAVRAAVR